MGIERTVTAVGPGLENSSLMADSWLFAKGLSSVRIVRIAKLSVAVCGPGRVRRSLSFVTDSDLVAFLRDTEYALASTGFRFRGYGADRRVTADRRATRRGAERRSHAPG